MKGKRSHGTVLFVMKGEFPRTSQNVRCQVGKGVKSTSKQMMGKRFLFQFLKTCNFMADLVLVGFKCAEISILNSAIFSTLATSPPCLCVRNSAALKPSQCLNCCNPQVALILQGQGWLSSKHMLIPPHLRKTAVICRSVGRIGHLQFQRVTHRKRLRITEVDHLCCYDSGLFTDRDRGFRTWYQHLGHTVFGVLTLF